MSIDDRIDFPHPPLFRFSNHHSSLGRTQEPPRFDPSKPRHHPLDDHDDPLQTSPAIERVRVWSRSIETGENVGVEIEREEFNHVCWNGTSSLSLQIRGRNRSAMLISRGAITTVEIQVDERNLFSTYETGRFPSLSSSQNSTVCKVSLWHIASRSSSPRETRRCRRKARLRSREAAL